MPYKSQAQRGKFHEMEKRGEISSATVDEFDRASKGMKLPKHVKNAIKSHNDRKRAMQGKRC
jgi:hypothetical protein